MSFLFGRAVVGPDKNRTQCCVATVLYWLSFLGLRCSASPGGGRQIPATGSALRSDARVALRLWSQLGGANAEYVGEHVRHPLFPHQGCSLGVSAQIGTPHQTHAHLPRPTQAGCWSSEVTAMFAHPERGDTTHENPPTFPGTGPARDGLSSLAGMPASGAKTAYLQPACVNVKCCRGQTRSGSWAAFPFTFPRCGDQPAQETGCKFQPQELHGRALRLWWQ